MIRLEFLMCVVILCTQIGNVHGQCAAGECTPSLFDADLTLDPDQACYADGSQVALTCKGTYGGPPSPYACNSGSWTFPFSPSCDLSYCDPPAVEDGLSVTPDQANYTFGDTVTYTCGPGEVTVGTDTAACDATGWNPSTIPICQAICDTPVIYNGDLTTSGPFGDGDTATVECHPNYDFGSGDSSTINCVEGSWDAIPSCYARCNVTGVPNSDEPIPSELTHGSTLTIECTSGYSYNQLTVFPLECTDGVIGTVPTTCYADCNILDPPENGGTDGGNLHGETTYYTCNRGFLLNDTFSETCDNGIWSQDGDAPTCHDLSLENSITLECNPSHFVVVVPLGLFDNPTAGTDSVIMGGCNGTYTDEAYIYLNSRYTDCDTTLTVDSAANKLVYENTLTNNDIEPVTTDGSLVVYIHCVFSQDNLVSSSAVEQDILIKDLDSEGQYSLSFGVYADMGYMTPIVGIYIETDSAIFLKAQVNNVLLLDVYPSTCYATPTSEADDSTTYTLINSGVSQSEEFATGLSQADVDSKPTFAFQSKAFRFSSHASQEIYIHCLLKICPDDDCPLPGGTRRRRSIRDTQLVITKHVLAGPIKIRHAREAEAVSTWQVTVLTIYSAVLSVFAAFTIGFAGMTMYRRRRSKDYEQI